MKHLIIYISILLFAKTVVAQNEEILKFCPELLQSTWTKPTNTTPFKVNVILPGVSNLGFGIYNSGFALGDIYTKRNDTAVISFSGLINNLKTNNYVGLHFNTSLLALQLNLKHNLGIGFSVNDRATIRFTYPGDLARLLRYGNGNYLGQTLNVGGFALNMNYYREYGLHVQKSFKKLKIGVSPKLLFGKLNINTRKSNISLLTDSSYYAITGTSEMEIETSGLNTSFVDDFNSGNTQTIIGRFFNPHNMGMAINIGAQYELTPKITVAAGVNDIGYLKWDFNNITYSSPKVNIVYEGLDINQLLQKDTLSFLNTLDSLKNIFKLNTVENKSYKTTLPAQFYAMGNYKLAKKTNVGGSLSFNGFNDRVLSSFTAAIHQDITKNFSAALSYTGKTRSPFNLGAAVVWRVAGGQLYIVSDNFTSLFSPLRAKTAGFTAGMNLTFGHSANKKKEKTEEKKNEALENDIEKLNKSDKKKEDAVIKELQKKKKKRKSNDNTSEL